MNNAIQLQYESNHNNSQIKKSFYSQYIFHKQSLDLHLPFLQGKLETTEFNFRKTKHSLTTIFASIFAYNKMLQSANCYIKTLAFGITD